MEGVQWLKVVVDGLDSEIKKYDIGYSTKALNAIQFCPTNALNAIQIQKQKTKSNSLKTTNPQSLNLLQFQICSWIFLSKFFISFIETGGPVARDYPEIAK